MDLVGMHMFARVAEAKSFSEAARQLQVSKSVISKHITRLEASLGVRLVNRTTRALSLTDVGQQFYERCAEIVAAAEDAERAVTHLQAEPRGTLKVAAPVSFGTLHLAPLLADMLHACPELHVHLTLTNRTVNLVEEAIDACLLIEQQPHPGTVARTVGLVRRAVCASPAYLDRFGAPESPHDLRNHACVLFAGSPSPRKWHLRPASGDVTVEVNGRMQINNLNAIRVAAVAGAGIALLPHYLLHADFRERRLVPLLPNAPPAEGTLCVAYAAHRHIAPKLRAFIDLLVARFRDSDEWDDQRDSTDCDRIAAQPRRGRASA